MPGTQKETAPKGGNASISFELFVWLEQNATISRIGLRMLHFVEQNFFRDSLREGFANTFCRVSFPAESGASVAPGGFTF